MIRHSDKTMVCDTKGCKAFIIKGGLAPAAVEVRALAKERGWVRRKDGPAGIAQDYCPACVAPHGWEWKPKPVNVWYQDTTGKPFPTRDGAAMAAERHNWKPGNYELRPASPSSEDQTL